MYRWLTNDLNSENSYNKRENKFRWKFTWLFQISRFILWLFERINKFCTDGTLNYLFYDFITKMALNRARWLKIFKILIRNKSTTISFVAEYNTKWNLPAVKCHKNIFGKTIWQLRSVLMLTIKKLAVVFNRNRHVFQGFLGKCFNFRVLGILENMSDIRFSIRDAIFVHVKEFYVL